MCTLVMTCGGESVANAAAIKRAAGHIVEASRRGHQVVAVIPAQRDTTSGLIQLAGEVSRNPSTREMDVLLSSAGRIAAALMVMAIHALGGDAVSLSGHQAGIVTDAAHTRARIVDIRPHRIHKELRDGRIVLVAASQGVSSEGDVTTFGDNGVGATAAALAAHLGTGTCARCYRPEPESVVRLTCFPDESHASEDQGGAIWVGEQRVGLTV